MSILIKGVKVPESCGECLQIGWQYVFECNLDDVKDGKKLITCPLSPVLPHGRLIDADKLKKTIRPITEEDDFNACTFRTVKELMKNHIDNAPTIIEAEGE